MRSLAALLILAIGGLLQLASLSAQERAPFKPVLQQQLESQMLPEVRFYDADFMDVLHYLQLQALNASKNAVRVSFEAQLPADFKPRYELTLDLKSVSFWQALTHLGGQAGVEFTVAGDSVRIRPLSLAAAEKAVRTVIPAPAPVPAPAPAPDKKVATRLGDGAKPFGAGSGNHYNSNGVLQPLRSGNVKHRNLVGWAIIHDRGGRLSMNCVDITRCGPNCDEACGCKPCACQHPKNQKSTPPPEP